ncbi:MAG: hypothetical protein LBO05_04215 [Deltaproteobacteria bacterium]|nr:hypothetical protein [Deltaproteobacteria bacterium]
MESMVASSGALRQFASSASGQSGGSACAGATGARRNSQGESSTSVIDTVADAPETGANLGRCLSFPTNSGASNASGEVWTSAAIHSGVTSVAGTISGSDTGESTHTCAAS